MKLVIYLNHPFIPHIHAQFDSIWRSKQKSNGEGKEREDPLVQIATPAYFWTFHVGLHSSSVWRVEEILSKVEK